jgi:hypothetical protein
MLDVDKLKDQIKTGIQNTVIPAIERIELKKQPTTSELGNEQAKEVATVFDEMVSEALADIIANAIDYYIKNANITGTIITVGSPSTQTANIVAAPTPITGGKIPNTFGIS